MKTTQPIDKIARALVASILLESRQTITRTAHEAAVAAFKRALKAAYRAGLNSTQNVANA